MSSMPASPCAANPPVSTVVGVTPPRTPLTPVFKWTGGKRRELVTFSKFYPQFVNDGGNYKFVEPFVGGGAVYWSLANPNSVINDYDEEIAIFYREMAKQDKRFLAAITRVATLFATGTHEQQEKAFYNMRALDRKPGLANLPSWKRAARFYIVNQLAFSGMRRFGSTGFFNIPFGHYKTFNPKLVRSPEHVALLRSTTILSGDYSAVLKKHDTKNTFIFLDPPYTRVMKTYSAGNEFGESNQRELAAQLRKMRRASWMLVIDKSDLTMELYGDLVVHTYALSYGANIRNRFSQTTEHIVVINYQVSVPITKNMAASGLS